MNILDTKDTRGHEQRHETWGWAMQMTMSMICKRDFKKRGTMWCEKTMRGEREWKWYWNHSKRHGFRHYTFLSLPLHPFELPPVTPPVFLIFKVSFYHVFPIAKSLWMIFIFISNVILLVYFFDLLYIWMVYIEFVRISFY